ncbi:alcohol dehydrogenase catalytic domain-containing protein [Nannocystaceae bacterium ST9]
MRALVFDGSSARMRDHDEPVPGSDEAIVHVRQAGICDTDLQILRGYHGFRGVLGHEFVGEVDGDDPSDLAGCRVVADINVGCGHCDECRARGGHHCPHRGVVGIRRRSGVLAERVALPRANLIALPSELDDDRAVFAEPLAAALHVLDELPSARARGPVEVLGDGKLGLLIALALHGAGVEVRLIGHHRSKLALAEPLGIATALERELDESDPRAAMIVEASGSPTGLARALERCRPGGTIVVKTTRADPITIDLAPLVVGELRLVGSRCGDMRRAVELLARGALDPRPLIEARFELEAAEQALALAAQPGRLKILVETNQARRAVKIDRGSAGL